MTTPHLFDDLTQDEGLRLKAYKDSRGIWTIGIGHNLQADPSMMSMLQHLIDVGITMDQARTLFEHDVKTAELGLDLHIPWWRKMDDERQDALVNLTFNLGVAKLLTWHHTLAFLQSGNYSGAGTELRGTEPWHSQVGARAERIASQIYTGYRKRQ
jgi:lysozyme